MKKKNKLHTETEKGHNAEMTNNKVNTSSNNDKNQDTPEEIADSSYENGAVNIEKASTDAITKLAEMQDKYLRLSAEFDNYRKRTLKEKMDISKYASEDILLKIIPFMDDFDRAIKHLNESTDYEGMKSGIELIYSKFNDFLKQNDVKEIEALNSNFDVDIHEAVAKAPVAEEEMKGKVVDVVQKGYYLQDKVLRFSKVVVGE
jgi:molecular chaperone GrpE